MKIFSIFCILLKIRLSPYNDGTQWDLQPALILCVDDISTYSYGDLSDFWATSILQWHTDTYELDNFDGNRDDDDIIAPFNGTNGNINIKHSHIGNRRSTKFAWSEERLRGKCIIL